MTIVTVHTVKKSRQFLLIMVYHVPTMLELGILETNRRASTPDLPVNTLNSAV